MAESKLTPILQLGNVDETMDYECRILIVGKTGNGKSTLGNKIVGITDVSTAAADNADEGDKVQHGFLVKSSFDAGTKQSEFQTGTRTMAGNPVTVKVVDTPGLYDPAEDLEYTLIEVTRSLSLCCPRGPHAIVFVIRCDVRFTGEEGAAFDEIIKLFGDGVKDHLIVVFTHGEELKGTPIEALLGNTQSKDLTKVTDVVGNRYVVFSNKPERQDTEMDLLLEKINDVSKGCTRNYTNESLAKLTTKIEEEEERQLMKDKGMSPKEANLAVRRIIVESNERNEFIVTLLKVMASSATFASIIGVAGGRVLANSHIVAIGAFKGGVYAGGAMFLASFVASIQPMIKQRTDEGKQCTIS